MSVYPYEVKIIYIDVHNDDGMGGGDIIYRKERVKKIPQKSGCKTQSMDNFVSCIKTKLAKALLNSEVKCIAPALIYTDYDYSGNLCKKLRFSLCLFVISLNTGVTISFGPVKTIKFLTFLYIHIFLMSEIFMLNLSFSLIFTIIMSWPKIFDHKKTTGSKRKEEENTQT